jgi:hypothetical protein
LLAIKGSIGVGFANPAAILAHRAFGLFIHSTSRITPAPLYSIQREKEIVAIEYGQQALHRSRRVPRSRLNVFADDPARASRNVEISTS